MSNIDELADEYREDEPSSPEPSFDRYSWLPEKFKDPEALAEAYRQAERKIQLQGQELSAARETLAAYEEQLATSPPLEQSQTLEAPQVDPLAVMHFLTQQAQATQPQVPQAMPAELVVAQAEELVARAVPDFNNYAPKVWDLLANDPAWGQQFEQAARSGGATAAAGVLGNAVQTLAAAGEIGRQDTRAMKLGAQGLTGGQSGRPDDNPQAEWDRIRQAGLGSYSDLMRG